MRLGWIALIAILCLSACAHQSGERKSNMPSYSVERDGVFYTEQDGEAVEAVTAVLTAQQDAWNRGDIDAFMEGYWKNEQLRFASGGTVVKGWQATIDRYKTRYKDRAAMGELAFSALEVLPLTDEAAIVHGAWRLQRANDAPSGLFTLVFHKLGDWVIVSDTTTSAD